MFTALTTPPREGGLSARSVLKALINVRAVTLPTVKSVGLTMFSTPFSGHVMVSSNLRYFVLKILNILS